MAEYGEWNRKGASLSDKTAKKEYGVSRDFIVKGIQAGRLEYRNGSVWGKERTNEFLGRWRKNWMDYKPSPLATKFDLSDEKELREAAKKLTQA